MSPFRLLASLQRQLLTYTVMEHGEALVNILVSHWKIECRARVGTRWVVVSSLLEL